MSENSEELWQRWANQRRSEQKSDGAHEQQDVDDLLKESEDDELSVSREEPIQSRPVVSPTKTDMSLTSMRRPTPLLSGRLANHLSEQTPRTIHTKNEPFKSVSESLVIDDVQEKAILAMSLVLTSHLTRFATTRFSEDMLTALRDKILHGFEAKEAVRIEVEAYDLLNWFAGAMNPDWQMRQPESTEVNKGETSEKVLLEIIEHAIHDQRDLCMRYYTGSRGEFSERIITPIAVTAEKYLVAYCHLRGEERVFRLSRIVQLSPVNPEEVSSELPMVYPSQSDTQLPPLPERPVPVLNSSEKKKSSKKSKASAESQEHKTKSVADAKKSVADAKKSVADVKITKEKTQKKKSAKKSEASAEERTLFDYSAQKPKEVKSETPSLLEYMKSKSSAQSDDNTVTSDKSQENEHEEKEPSTTPRIPGL